MPQQADWTAPFYGVQHLIGLRKGFMVRIVDRGAFSECHVRSPAGGPLKSSHETAELARAHAVSQALGLDAFAIGALA